MPRKSTSSSQDIALKQFSDGQTIVWRHPLFVPLLHHARIVRNGQSQCPQGGWAIVTSNGEIHVHPTRRGEPAEWAYVLAHCLLHLGFMHFVEKPQPREWNAACDLVTDQFLKLLKIGRPPEAFLLGIDLPGSNEEQLYETLCTLGLPGYYYGDMVIEPPRRWGMKIDWQHAFGSGLAAAVTSAVDVAGGRIPHLGAHSQKQTPAQQARDWFINTYPLLGALAAAFTIIENPQVCNQIGISVAAVDIQQREIYINPTAGLDVQECRFVMAHELLHVGLRHDARCMGRDPYLWNVACDYVINAWLVEMRVGHMPRIGGLYDPALKDESAEAIYDRIVTDMRRYRKIVTLRGIGLGDMIDRGSAGWWRQGEGVDLDNFYRQCLMQGLDYHQSHGRGFLPRGLIEEIQSLSQPPIPWDVELARWFDHLFPPIEQRRSYARPSRRQAATPDIPRPRYIPSETEMNARTFGVVLDTSGSMQTELLAKALGAIASYSISHDVTAVRVVFCDAVTYDQGYMPPEAIANRVKVRGRGGTILQPAIDMLEITSDFPQKGPLLIITDGYCDRLVVRQEHAFILPQGHHLPFVPKGPVFRIV